MFQPTPQAPMPLVRVLEPTHLHPVATPTNPQPTKSFVEANTQEATLHHLKNDCIIPVFSKDNEMTLSHSGFVETVWGAARSFFSQERIADPEIRVSHIVKGRTPEAIHKPVHELLDRDKTIYYERMMFCFEVPTIYQDVSGNRLNLTIGGVRAYNHENLYSRKSIEKFKVFVGFKNLVCCNMCLSTDGYKAELRTMSLDELGKAVLALLAQYNPQKHLQELKRFSDYGLTAHQFAQFLGKSRLYQHLPAPQRRELPELLMTDTQINLVAKSYYTDKDFGVRGNGSELSMWRFYNLLTGANKSSYIDQFLDRSLNAFDLSTGLCQALQSAGKYSWFLE